MKRAPLLVALALGCGDTAPPGFSSGPPVTTAPGTTGSSSMTADSTSTGGVDSTSTGADGTSTATRHDVGSDIDFDSNQPPGCRGKVDLLFLISRQELMQHVQEQYLASIPGFVETIEERLAGFDVHIMAANPDGKWTGFNCQKEASCGTYWPHCAEGDVNWDCETSVQEFELCDAELGAGVTFNAGADATNKRCELYLGNRYIVSGQPEMTDALECIAKAGWWGPDPPIGDALIAAVSSTLNGFGGCNEGFLREDALLVVVIIANTEDGKTLSSPKIQYDKIVAAKGDPNSVVMLAITAPSVGPEEPDDPDCIFDFNNSGNFLPLLEQFTYHLRGDACADSYVPFFEEAVGLIDTACGKFIPQ